MNDIKLIPDILNNSRTIAIVGFSANHTRPSNRIGRYMRGNGFIVYGVNPGLDKTEVDEIRCFAKLSDLPEQPDIINIFRRSEFVFDIIQEIIEMNYIPKAVWTQIGVISSEAKEAALSNGIVYIENKCIMVEHNNL
ncbi:MAG TPA: CoA-binding protein [Ignavibacteria bacterium]|nr:CoA-binding protein [Ignavibacteria bacterium]